MQVVGYTDRLSVAPGETIRFMVSCQQPRYRAEIVKLIHGDPNPQGPGFKEEAIQTPVTREYAGRDQPYHHGSAVLVPDHAALGVRSVTLAAWVWPTTPQKGAQGLLTKWSAPERRGYALVIDASGALGLWLGGDGGQVQLSTDVPLRAGSWYFVAASYDAESGQVVLVQESYPSWPVDPTRALVQRSAPSGAIGQSAAPLVMAAWQEGEERGGIVTGGHFNGKLEAPLLFGAALGLEHIEALREGAQPGEVSAALVGAWDFSEQISSTRVVDLSRNGLDGETRQMPARAMKGHDFSGRVTNWTQAPEEYGAIHFHDDDLVDCQWEADFELTVPESMRSGVYAAKLSTEGGEDYLPFFVRPKDRKATAKALWLVPTNSYLAYANEHVMDSPEVRQALSPDFKFPTQEQEAYVIDHHLLSCYDRHSDGSGVCYSSYLRPIVTNLRPKVRLAILGNGTGYPHQFNADLHLVDWLTEQGFDFDVATDEDLQFEGLGLLSQYRVVLTGSHHEYWTEQGLDSLEAYLQDGGRFMYLAGNGLYWVTGFVPGHPKAIEVRRWGGTQSWTAVPGEYFFSSTGEQGGLWRERGRPPQQYVGVGFTTQGFDVSLPYVRQPGSFDPRAKWIFEGVGDDEEIGGFGLVMEGACGFETDRADHALGTPPHALILGTATGFSDSYQHVIEEVALSDSKQGGTVNPQVKGDMVFFETPNGGAVFSTGSISYCGSLSHNGYDNNVSRITGNALRRFLSDEPFG